MAKWLCCIFLTSVTLLPGSGAAASSALTVDINPKRQVLITLANPPQPGLGPAGSTWRGWSWSGGYRPSSSAVHKAEKIGLDYRLRQVEAWPIALLNMYCVVYELAAGDVQADVVAALNRDARIELAQAMQAFDTDAASDEPAPDNVTDQSTTDQADENPDALPDRKGSFLQLQHSHRDLNLAPLHRHATGRGVRIAIIDTGAQITHPDIKRRVIDHEDFVLRRADVFADDIHGTAIAGVIAATSANGKGILGVAPESALMILKACWPVREGSAAARCNSFTLARALSHAIERRANVINLSLSGPPDSLLEKLVNVALDRGILIVGSVAPDPGKKTFPTNIQGVIAVSNKTSPSRAHTIPAPGTDIISTVPKSGYEYFSGHSFAAAHVSGVVALLRELDNRLTPKQSGALLSEAMSPRANSLSSLDACSAASNLRAQVICD